MSEPLKSCPDCSGELRPIKVVSPTEGGTKIGGRNHEIVGYAEESARKTGMSLTYELSGFVRGFICSECDRLFLYGKSRYESLG